MMHIRFSLIAADPRVLAGCIGYLMRKIRIVLFAAALRMAVVTSLPDIERYVRMRQM
jgi:hypothetical protein